MGIKIMENVSNNNLSLVSIIIPCRNEEIFIGKCLDSIIANNYPKEMLEVLLVDGMSEDGTRKIVKEYAKQYPFIKILDNLRKITPCALNLGIKSAQGELILWMSAHNEYEKEYISKCVEYIEEFQADAVGGIIKSVPRNNSFIGKSICRVLSCPFGVGGSLHKTGVNNPQWVDTAFGVCYKKEVFYKIGFFNEKLIRGQDMEFSLRLKKVGLKTLLVPEIVSYYYARSDLKSFIKHNFINGLWAILPFKYTNIIPVSLRHLVPLEFVLSLFGALILSLFWDFFWWIFVFIILSYIAVNFYFSLRIAVKEKDGRLIFTMPIIFAIFHFSYGLGSVLGVVKCIFSRSFWRNLRTFFTNK